jgi:DNA-binding GntR family transcriptional regulator
MPNTEKILYRKIAGALRTSIEAGVYPPGSRLPSEKVLSSELGVGRETLREAFGLLDTYVDARPGVGRFVRQRDAWGEVRKKQTLSPSSRRVAAGILDDIQSEALLPGTHLPTEAEWNQIYRTGKNNVRSAIQYLATYGVITTRKGQRTSVANVPPGLVGEVRSDLDSMEQISGEEKTKGERTALVQKGGHAVRVPVAIATTEAARRRNLPRIETPIIESGNRDVWEEAIRRSGRTPEQTVDITVKKPTKLVVDDLSITTITPVYEIRRVRYIDSNPYDITYTYIPVELRPDLDIESSVDPATDLQRNSRIVGQIELREPSQEVVRMFGLPKNKPLLMNQSNFYDESGKPVGLRIQMMLHGQASMKYQKRQPKRVNPI